MITTVRTVAAGTRAASARVDFAGDLLATFAPSPPAADVLLHRGVRADRPVQRLLLALGGTSSPEAAVLAAARIAASHEASVEVLAVYEPRIPYPAAPSRHSLRRLEEHDRPAAEEQLARARAQLRTMPGVGHDAGHWPMHLAIGQAAATISRVAQARGADVIVMGRGHRAGDERWLCDRTALRVALVSAVPILTVQDSAVPPARLLIATGLDALSLRVASTARRLFPDAAVELLHVRADERTTTEEVLAHFRRLELVLALPPGRVTHTRLTGNAVDAALAHIVKTRPHCVAVGLYGATIVERASDENVALHLVEEGPCNLLVVPA